jgi:hypothetical protein
MFTLLSVQDPRLKPTWVTDLPNLFSEAGFIGIEADKNDCPPSGRTYYTNVVL